MLAGLTLLSGTAGGAVAGALVGALGAFVPTGARVAVGTCLGLLLTISALFWPGRLPQIDRETEQSLLGRGPVVWSLANGFLLGTGVTSRIGFWIFYLVPVGCFVTGVPALGAAIWAGYGFTRLAAVAVLARAMRHEPDRMGEFSARLLALRPTLRRAAGPATAVLAFALALWLGI